MDTFVLTVQMEVVWAELATSTRGGAAVPDGGMAAPVTATRWQGLN